MAEKQSESRTDMNISHLLLEFTKTDIFVCTGERNSSPFEWLSDAHDAGATVSQHKCAASTMSRLMWPRGQRSMVFSVIQAPVDEYSI